MCYYCPVIISPGLVTESGHGSQEGHESRFSQGNQEGPVLLGINYARNFSAGALRLAVRTTSRCCLTNTKGSAGGWYPSLGG